MDPLRTRQSVLDFLQSQGVRTEAMLLSFDGHVFLAGAPSNDTTTALHAFLNVIARLSSSGAGALFKALSKLYETEAPKAVPFFPVFPVSAPAPAPGPQQAQQSAAFHGDTGCDCKICAAKAKVHAWWDQLEAEDALRPRGQERNEQWDTLCIRAMREVLAELDPDTSPARNCH